MFSEDFAGRRAYLDVGVGDLSKIEMKREPPNAMLGGFPMTSGFARAFEARCGTRTVGGEET